jgi:cytochrome d ubiquinol oxidase subunit II
MIFDYETLKVIWWCFIGVLLIGFAIMDGFDLGAEALLPFVARNDEERRVVINAVGPVWDGNQVWLILGGGALFAAWPLVYASAFSGFYIAMLLVLFALILRPGGFDYRSKMPGQGWRNFWDWTLFVSGAVPALVLGVAFGNLLQGVPFHLDDSLRSFYTGNFFGLLNPFALLAGVVSLSMLVMHGAVFLQIRSDGAVYRRARVAAILFAVLFIVAFAAAGLWLAYGIPGYHIVSIPDVNHAVNPLAKVVERSTGAWLHNYSRFPWMIIAPIAAFAGAFMAIGMVLHDRPGRAFICSGAAIAGVILTTGLSMFPFIMPSSTDPNSSLTAWDATSSHWTLMWMFWATIIFLPIVLTYTSWAYRVMRGKITVDRIRETTHSAY